ncbi:MAG: hypothetical protein ACOZAK_01495 [Patescibacteria group bacterium]
MRKKSTGLKKKTPPKSKRFSPLRIAELSVLMSVVLSISLIAWAVYTVKAAVTPIVYVQDFEKPPNLDAGGTYNYDWYLPNSSEPAITQVAGNNSLPASSGDYYGVVSKAGSYSHFGECLSGGTTDIWLTQIDVYLDTGWQSGQGFNYAIETRLDNPEGPTYKHFIFNVAKDKSTKSLLIGVSDELNYELSEDLENFNHYKVKKSGWFTLRSKIRSEKYQIFVDMFVLDEGKQVVWQDTLTSEDFSYNNAALLWNCKATFTVLYNGYTVNDPASELPSEDSGFNLPIDNHKLVLYKEIDLVGPPLTKAECDNNGWQTFNWQTFSEPTFKSQGDCVSYLESSSNAEGNLK